MPSTAMNLRPERFKRHDTTTGPIDWLDSLPNATDHHNDDGLTETQVDPLGQAKSLAASLLSEQSEASGAKIARELHALLQTLDTKDRVAFQRFLATNFAPDAAVLRAAAEAYLSSPAAYTAASLAQAADPPRQELLRRMNMPSGGTRALVDMRKEIIGRLRSELPHLTQFSTLSPVPGFRRWLSKRAATTNDPEIASLARLEATSEWLDSPQSASLQTQLMTLCADYLTHKASPKDPADSVARFHLGNGARLERINWRGNTAAGGVQESFGIMVNYLYDLKTIESNHEAFVRDGSVARSAEVDALLRSEGAFQ